MLWILVSPTSSIEFVWIRITSISFASTKPVFVTSMNNSTTLCSSSLLINAVNLNRADVLTDWSCVCISSFSLVQIKFTTVFSWGSIKRVFRIRLIVFAKNSNFCNWIPWSNSCARLSRCSLRKRVSCATDARKGIDIKDIGWSICVAA